MPEATFHDHETNARCRSPIADSRHHDLQELTLVACDAGFMISRRRGYPGRRRNMENPTHFNDAWERLITSSPGDFLKPEEVAEVLQMSLRDLAGLANISLSSMLYASASPRVQEFLHAVGKTLQLACEAGADRERALRWYRFEPLAPFNGKTAEQLVTAGWAQSVQAYLQSIIAGPAS